MSENILKKDNHNANTVLILKERFWTKMKSLANEHTFTGFVLNCNGQDMYIFNHLFYCFNSLFGLVNQALVPCPYHVKEEGFNGIYAN